MLKEEDQPDAQAVECIGVIYRRFEESGLQERLYVFCMSAVKGLQEESGQSAGV